MYRARVRQLSLFVAMFTCEIWALVTAISNVQVGCIASFLSRWCLPLESCSYSSSRSGDNAHIFIEASSSATVLILSLFYSAIHLFRSNKFMNKPYTAKAVLYYFISNFFARSNILLLAISCNLKGYVIKFSGLQMKLELPSTSINQSYLTTEIFQ